MILNILPDYLCRYFISYGSGEISVFRKLSTPKLFLHFRIFSKDHARADTLQHAYNFRYTIARWKRQKYVNMVPSYFHRIYRKSMVYGYFFEYLPLPVPVCLLEASTSDTLEPIPNGISCLYTACEVLWIVMCSA